MPEWERPLGLFGLPLDLQVYRFLWLRSFHPPIVVRVERSGETCTLFARQGGLDTGELSVDRSRPMTPVEWKDLERRAADSFWPLPTKGGCQGGFDGASWLVEGRRLHKYHAVNRWSPDEGNPFREFCLRFIELSGLAPDRVY